MEYIFKFKFVKIVHDVIQGCAVFSRRFFSLKLGYLFIDFKTRLMKYIKKTISESQIQNCNSHTK